MLDKESLANAKGNVQAQCEQNLSSPILATMFLLHSPEGARWHDQSRLTVLDKIANFPHPISFSALARGDSFRIYGKALLILKL